jgi:hypothetical protein
LRGLKQKWEVVLLYLEEISLIFGETLVVRDNNDNSLSFHSFPHERGYFWSPKDVKEFIKSIGWYDLETLRHGETVSECVSRMPPRFPGDHR